MLTEKLPPRAQVDMAASDGNAKSTPNTWDVPEEALRHTLG